MPPRGKMTLPNASDKGVTNVSVVNAAMDQGRDNIPASSLKPAAPGSDEWQDYKDAILTCDKCGIEIRGRVPHGPACYTD